MPTTVFATAVFATAVRPPSLLRAATFLAATFLAATVAGGCSDPPAAPGGGAAGPAGPASGFVECAEECGVAFQMHFLPTEQGLHFKINLYDHGCGVCAADYDQDGDDDLLFLNQLGPNALYRNDGRSGGKLRFTDVTAVAGVAIPDRVCVGACFADIDADGDQDLYITTTRAGNAMFRNDGGDRFTEVTEAAGLALVAHSETPCFFDSDGDGDLDLFVTNTARWTTDAFNADGRYFEGPKTILDLIASPVEHNVLYRNDGGWKFTDVTAEAGVAGGGWGGDVATLDYDQDGDLDLFVGNMFGKSTLLRNDGGRFTDVTAATLGKQSWGAMGVKVLDYDGDGRLDLYVTDMHSDMWTREGLKLEHIKPEVRYEGPEGPLVELGTIRPRDRDDLRALLRTRVSDLIFGSTLFRNLGGGKFQESGLEARAETFWPWGAVAADFDHDGDEDMFIPAGMGYPFLYWPSSYLVNDGRGVFADAAAAAGLEPPPGGQFLPDPIGGMPASRSARCAATADFDGDGRPDIAVQNFNDRASLWLNRMPARNWVAFRLHATKAAPDAIGATVTLVSGGRTMIRQIDATGGYLAQVSRVLNFGLGGDAGPVSVAIRWPDGTSQKLTGVAPGRVHDVIEAAR